MVSIPSERPHTLVFLAFLSPFVNCLSHCSLQHYSRTLTLLFMSDGPEGFRQGYAVSVDGSHSMPSPSWL